MRDVPVPTRREALSRLEEFVPLAGRDYAERRDFDLPGHPHVSVLSPFIRHRVLTEEDVLHAVLAHHTPETAGKFVQEVFWRTYWKGWLELRPSVWTEYRSGVARGLDRVATEAGLRQNWEAACKGETGITAFDHWATELASTGYLHNHARLWFASIWIFTLELQWELGADFFLRHLLDGDAASNTLNWRWMAGLQTKGRPYVAGLENIAKYTRRRFGPGMRLNTEIAPIEGPAPPPPGPAPESRPLPSGTRIGLVLTEDDLSPDFLLPADGVPATLLVSGARARSPLETAARVLDFTEGVFADTVARYGDRLGSVAGPVHGNIEKTFARWLDDHDLDGAIMPYVPVGPAADLLAPVRSDPRLGAVLRDYDAHSWPHATAGFFRFRKRIPELIDRFELCQSA